MKSDDAKDIAVGLKDLTDNYVDAARAIRSAASTVQSTKKLWNDGKHSWLTKVGVALIVFPDPTISDIVGSAFVAAGLVQEGIRRRTLHVDDVAKTFHQTMKELQNVKGFI
jgi:hypothetical protein